MHVHLILEQVPANKEATTQAVLFATPVQTYKL